MTSSQQDSGLLDASVPLWKRELIVRRRAVSKAGLASRGESSAPTTAGVMRSVEVVRPGQAATSRAVLDNGVVKTRTLSSNNNCEHEGDGSSDSSEELQYGPGIVNRLRSKYLSLALRETQARPALANLRRYSSLENLLDGDVSAAKTQQSVGETQETGPRSRTQSRSSRKDSMKRARSVETLHRYDPRLPLATGIRDVNRNRPASMINPLVNEEVVIVENKTKAEPRKREGKVHAKEKAPLATQRTRIAPQPLPVTKELPPPDAVKQKLKIFESSRTSARLVKTFVAVSKVRPQVDVNSVSAARTIPNANVSRDVFSKPALSPKPNVAENVRTQIPARPASPRVAAVEDRRPGRMSPALVHNASHLEPVSTSNSLDSSPILHQRLSPVSVPNIRSPRVAAQQDRFPTALPSTPLLSRQTNGNAPVLAADSCSEDEDVNDGVKRISASALENIRKDGASVSFNFGGANDKQRSHLPGTRTAMSNKSRAPSPAKLEPSQGKQVGVIRPILTGQPRPASPTIHPTSREAEKNLINRVKSIEQPTKKVTPVPTQVRSESMGGSVTKAPGLWEEKKPWNQQQNTVVFNFSGNKEPVPDYIENDGVILRSKLRRPPPGESGIILLGVNADESSDFDTEEERLSRLGPPSPCNVVFEGANVLINGKSSMARQPRDPKLRITFCEVLTSTFEYPSESSLLEDHPAALPPAPSTPSPALPSPLGGSSLASYTPSKVRLGSEDFQLGITRTNPILLPQPAALNTLSSELQPHQEEEEETYLKPAQDGDTVAWSAETAADLLF